MAGKDFSEMENNGELPRNVTVLQMDKAEKKKAKDIMKYGVVTVKRQTPVYQAIASLVARRITSLPVVDDNMHLEGIISEKDVLKLLYDTQFKGGNVEDFMTEEVISFDQEDSLADICDCFINNHFRSIAILDKDKLASVISRSDIISANKDKFGGQDLSPNSTKHKNVFTATDVMKHGLFTVKRQTPIYEAVDILLKRDITGLPVVDDYMNLIGVISEKDFLKLLYNSHTKPEKVENIMTKKIVSFNCDDSLADICNCLINNHFRRVVILDQGKLVGIISRTDIIAFILKNRTAVLKDKCAD